MTDKNVDVRCRQCGARFVTSVFTGADIEDGVGAARCPACGCVQDRPMRTDDGVLIPDPDEVLS